jgi:hypothetical protein
MNLKTNRTMAKSHFGRVLRNHKNCVIALKSESIIIVRKGID